LRKNVTKIDCGVGVAEKGGEDVRIGGAPAMAVGGIDAPGRTKPAISPKRLKIERKLLLTGYINSYNGFPLSPKCMILNNLCARFEVIDSLNAAKMAKCSLLVTSTPCRVLCLW